MDNHFLSLADLYFAICWFWEFSLQKKGKQGEVETEIQFGMYTTTSGTQVAGAWSERKKMFHGGSFLKLADDDV